MTKPLHPLLLARLPRRLGLGPEAPAEPKVRLARVGAAQLGDQVVGLGVGVVRLNGLGWVGLGWLYRLVGWLGLDGWLIGWLVTLSLTTGGISMGLGGLSGVR